MLQVYDRVVNSRNNQTLLMLTLLVVGLYALLELFSWVRLRMLQSTAVDFDTNVKNKVFELVFNKRKDKSSSLSPRAFEDLRTLREWIVSPAVGAIIDAPFAFFTLLLLFYIHPRIGIFSTIALLIQLVIGWFNQKGMNRPLEKANESNFKAQQYASTLLRSSEAIHSMGMLKGLESRWAKHQQDALEHQATASDTAGSYSALSKLFSNLQGSLVLGVGCWLALEGEIPSDGGLMIGGSILAGRVMAPFVTLIGQWRQVLSAWSCYGRLAELLSNYIDKNQGMALPDPKGHLKVENIVVNVPNREVPIIRGVTFTAEPGEVIALIGPSASGKSTLAKVLVGAWIPSFGKVRLDEADINNWSKDNLGSHIGYLSQTIELFDGSITQNVGRFGEIDENEVHEACKWVGLDKIISAMPDGYDTQIGFEGGSLSGGMRQRIALARAIYKRPKLVVLDEPNSSLDEIGEKALQACINYLKQSGSLVVVVSHRTNILTSVDKIMVLADGQIKGFGPKDEVLAAMRGQSKSKPNQQGGAK